jgi:thiamine biosynthesis lipoprotein
MASTGLQEETSLRMARAAMGTRFEVAIPRARYRTENREFPPQPVDMQAAAEEALDEIEWHDRRLSLFRKDSFLSHVNRNAAAGPVPVDPDLFELLEVCRDVHAASSGAFDVSVGFLMRQWGFHGGDEDSSAKDLHSKFSILGPVAAQGAVGFERVVLDGAKRTVRFERPMRLDLGGVAKGFALDRAAEMLREAGIESALLHGGTSTVVALGGPAPGESWKIGVRNPRGGLIAAADLRGGALAVSAPHGRMIERNGRMRGHLIDPATGEPAEGAALVAVVAESATLADAWSTALLVAGPDRFDDLAGRAEGIRAALMTTNPAADPAPAAAASAPADGGAEPAVTIRGCRPQIFKTRQQPERERQG